MQALLHGAVGFVVGLLLLQPILDSKITNKI